MVVHESDSAESNSKRKIPGRLWPDWYPVLATFRKPDARKATWQLINTIVPYCGLWYLMIRSNQLDYPYTFTLILALPTAAFMVRLSILFHDSVHGSFFRCQNVNTFFGYFLWVLVFAPFQEITLIISPDGLCSQFMMPMPLQPV
jgi:omega-6 fatty acid desaturase (delta-12 desaturase)